MVSSQVFFLLFAGEELFINNGNSGIFAA